MVDSLHTVRWSDGAQSSLAEPNEWVMNDRECDTCHRRDPPSGLVVHISLSS